MYIVHRISAHYLIGGWPAPLKNIGQLGLLFPLYGKIKNVPNHQPVIDLDPKTAWFVIQCTGWLLSGSPIHGLCNSRGIKGRWITPEPIISQQALCSHCPFKILDLHESLQIFKKKSLKNSQHSSGELLKKANISQDIPRLLMIISVGSPISISALTCFSLLVESLVLDGKYPLWVWFKIDQNWVAHYLDRPEK